MERLWLHLGDNRLSHCVFSRHRGGYRQLLEAWHWLFAETGRIRSLCPYP
jgi:hypothetical protein